MSASLIKINVKKHAHEDTIYRCLYGYYFLGMKKAQLAKVYRKKITTISNWITKFEQEGVVGRSVVHVYKKFDYQKRKWLVDLYHQKPILYQREAAMLFFEQFQCTISISSISLILHQEGLTWKVIERRAMQLQMVDVMRYFNELTRVDWSLEQLVFLDEVSFDNTDMLRKKGYAVKGKSLVYRGEFCRKARVSLLCFLNTSGIIDCYHTEGTFDRLKFLHFCIMFALQHAQKYPGRNSVWIMDGATIHTDPNIILYLRSLGIIPIFLPAYAPFFNPIEIVFGLVKKLLKQLFRENSGKNVLYCIALAMKLMQRKSCKQIFKKCGYIVNGRFDPSIGLNQKIEEFGFC